jgi:diphthine-ammonia ligase
MKSAVLYSGGKDSNHALWWAVRSGAKVAILISMISESSESWMFHYPNIKYTLLQAESLDIPLMTRVTSGRKDEELVDLEVALREAIDRYNIDSVISGAIESNYQRSRIDRICFRLGLDSLVPLWHCDPERLILEEISAGFETIITACMANGLSREWLGRQIDRHCLEDLKSLRDKYHIHLSFEGGEGETFVLDGPLFKDKIRILESETCWQRDSGYFLIRKTELVPKL